MKDDSVIENSHPDNPVFAHPSLQKCNECGGNHECTGAWRDCLNYWKMIAGENYELVTTALSLLSAATPNQKLLTETRQRQWADEFSKWWARAFPRSAI